MLITLSYIDSPNTISFINASQESHLYALFSFNLVLFKLDYFIRVRLNLVTNKLILF